MNILCDCRVGWTSHIQTILTVEEHRLPELAEVRVRMNGWQFDHLWERWQLAARQTAGQSPRDLTSVFPCLSLAFSLPLPVCLFQAHSHTQSVAPTVRLGCNLKYTASQIHYWALCSFLSYILFLHLTIFPWLSGAIDSVYNPSRYPSPRIHPLFIFPFTPVLSLPFPLLSHPSFHSHTSSHSHSLSSFLPSLFPPFLPFAANS